MVDCKGPRDKRELGGADVPYWAVCVPNPYDAPLERARFAVPKLYLTLHKGDKVDPRKEEQCDVGPQVILPAGLSHKTKEITPVIKSSSESSEAQTDRRGLCPRWGWGEMGETPRPQPHRKSQPFCPGWQKLATPSAKHVEIEGHSSGSGEAEEGPRSII